MSLLSQDQLQIVLDELADRAWAVSDQLIPAELCERLLTQARHYQQEGTLRPAAVGRREGLHLDQGIRSDVIRWLSSEASCAEQDFLLLLSELMQEIRSQLYVPVREYEAHFAIYEAGSSYAKHFDRFRDADERELSTVLFLNRDWTAEQGGALRLYDSKNQEQCIETILPTLGRFVLFRSDRIPHEVLPPLQTRYSIAGWMRRSTPSFT